MFACSKVLRFGGTTDLEEGFLECTLFGCSGSLGSYSNRVRGVCMFFFASGVGRSPLVCCGVVGTQLLIVAMSAPRHKYDADGVEHQVAALHSIIVASTRAWPVRVTHAHIRDGTAVSEQRTTTAAILAHNSPTVTRLKYLSSSSNQGFVVSAESTRMVPAQVALQRPLSLPVWRVRESCSLIESHVVGSGCLLCDVFISNERRKTRRNIPPTRQPVRWFVNHGYKYTGSLDQIVALWYIQRCFLLANPRWCTPQSV